MAPLPSVVLRPAYQNLSQAIFSSWLHLSSAIILPIQSGLINLAPSYTLTSNRLYTTVGFTLPLDTKDRIVSNLKQLTLIKSVRSIVVSIPTITWNITGTYSITTEPNWCTTWELFICWLAQQHPGATMTYSAAKSTLDFKVAMISQDLGNLNLIVVKYNADSSIPVLADNITLAGNNVYAGN